MGTLCLGPNKCSSVHIWGGGGSEKKYGLYMCENVDNYGCPVRGTNHAQITEINII